MRRLFVALLSVMLVAAACGGAKEGTGSAPTAGTGTPVQSSTPASRLPNGKPQWASPPAMQIDPSQTYSAILETSMGRIKIELWAKEAPKTVNSFVFLARQGFYDGTTFHRIIKDFMIRGGDPLGDGTGGPGYRFEDELPVKHSYEAGIVAMANAGPNTQGSQFFICSGPDARYLDTRPNYTQFGRVVEGMEVVLAISSVEVEANRWGELSKPKQPVVINRVTVEQPH